MLQFPRQGRAAEPCNFITQPHYRRVLLAKLAHGHSGNPGDFFLWFGKPALLHLPSIYAVQMTPQWNSLIKLDAGVPVKFGTGAPISHFDIRPEEDMRAPCHAWLALSDAKPAVANRDPQDGSRLVAAALIKAFREARLIDIKPRIERLHRNDEVHELKTMRKLVPQVDRTITGLAGKS